MMISDHSPTAEQAVIGSLILDNDCWHDVFEILQAADFHTRIHRDIFRALAAKLANGEPADIVTLHGVSGVDGELVAQIAEGTPSSKNAVAYARTVREHADRRRVRVALTGALESVQGGQPLPEVFAGLESSLAGTQRAGQPDMTWADAAQHGQATIEQARHLRGRGGVVGAPTGLPTLDRRTGGLHGPRLWIIAGRPGLGKSALALQAAVHAAQRGHRVGICSLEMGPDELFTRAVAADLGINVTGLTTGEATACDEFQSRLGESSVRDLPIALDTTTYDLHGICARIAGWHRRQPLSFAVVDHIQLVETERFGKRDEQVGAITRAFKKLTTQIGIPIIAASQLNRSAQREGRRPELSDLRDSGNIEQDADVCLFIHEPPDEDGERSTGIIHLELGLPKNRMGVRGWLPAHYEFDGRRQRIRELAHIADVDAYRDAARGV